MADKNGRPDNIQDYLASLHEGQWFGFDNKDNTYENLVILDNTKQNQQNKNALTD